MAIDLKGLSKLLTPVTDEEAAKIMELRTAVHAHRYVRATRTKTFQRTVGDQMKNKGNLDRRNKA